MSNIINKLNKINIKYPNYPKSLDEKIFNKINNKPAKKVFAYFMIPSLITSLLIILLVVTFTLSNDNRYSTEPHSNLFSIEGTMSANYMADESTESSQNDFTMYYKITIDDEIPSNDSLVNVKIDLSYYLLPSLNNLDFLEVKLLTNGFTTISGDTIYLSNDELNKYRLKDNDEGTYKDSILFTFKLNEEDLLDKSLEIIFSSQINTNDGDLNQTKVIELRYIEINGIYLLDKE